MDENNAPRSFPFQNYPLKATPYDACLYGACACRYYGLPCSDMRDLLAFSQVFASAELFIAHSTETNARVFGQAKAILSRLDNSQTFGTWV